MYSTYRAGWFCCNFDKFELAIFLLKSTNKKRLLQIINFKLEPPKLYPSNMNPLNYILQT